MTTTEPLKTPLCPALNESLARTRLMTMRSRLKLSVSDCADMLNVSTYAVIKWENGTRAVAPATMRLIEILEMLEVMAPDMHAQFLPAKG